jgi:hypothetical protein
MAYNELLVVDIVAVYIWVIIFLLDHQDTLQARSIWRNILWYGKWKVNIVKIWYQTTSLTVLPMLFHRMNCHSPQPNVIQPHWYKSVKSVLLRTLLAFVKTSTYFMAVHGESSKWFLQFHKSNSLVASSSPYNWHKIKKFVAINICCFVKFVNQTKVMKGNFSVRVVELKQSAQCLRK